VSASAVAEVPRDVALDLHGVVENATDTNQTRMGEPVKQKMPRTQNDPLPSRCMLAAVAQMIAANILAELGPRQAFRSVPVRPRYRAWR
jgi:hypothetical protein